MEGCFGHFLKGVAMKKLVLPFVLLCAAPATAQPPNPAPSKFEINQFDIHYSFCVEYPVNSGINMKEIARGDVKSYAP